MDLGRPGRAKQGTFAKTKGSLPTEINQTEATSPVILLFWSRDPLLFYV